eukprot:comp6750_c0_seq1/m.2528 comp6750_c0_seq1/g.2528  ORF comp6750_c0_seq1/g.2528 comp6750_c0_seq1/m.2528 type:complete len:330 (-) comp6750_c0_seq1:45-1034(-)
MAAIPFRSFFRSNLKGNTLLRIITAAAESGELTRTLPHTPLTLADIHTSTNLLLSPLAPLAWLRGDTRKIRETMNLYANMQAIRLLQAATQTTTPSFTITRRPSIIPGAGDGVFIASGKVTKGAAVVLYAGTATIPPPSDVDYLPVSARMDDLEAAKSATDEADQTPKAIGKGSDKILVRLDGVHLDGMPWEIEREGKIAGNEHVSNCVDLREHGYPLLSQVQNSFALGHLVNHPPKGYKTNVECWPIDLELTSLDRNLRKAVPYAMNRYWYTCALSLETISVPPEIPLSRMPGMAMFALEDLEEGQELFFDYRLDPKTAPEWYTPYKE